MACSRPAEPAMVSRSISAHPAIASMRPTAALCRRGAAQQARRAPPGQAGQHGAHRPPGGRPDHHGSADGQADAQVGPLDLAALQPAGGAGQLDAAPAGR